MMDEYMRPECGVSRVSKGASGERQPKKYTTETQRHGDFERRTTDEGRTTTDDGIIHRKERKGRED
jgi:hypothetical protein